MQSLWHHKLSAAAAGMFGASNPTCDYSWPGTVMEALRWVKCPSGTKQARNILGYGKNGQRTPQITYVVRKRLGGAFAARGGCEDARRRGGAPGHADAGGRLCGGISGLPPCVYG